MYGPITNPDDIANLYDCNLKNLGPNACITPGWGVQKGTWCYLNQAEIDALPSDFAPIFLNFFKLYQNASLAPIALLSIRGWKIASSSTLAAIMTLKKLLLDAMMTSQRSLKCKAISPSTLNLIAPFPERSCRTRLFLGQTSPP